MKRILVFIVTILVIFAAGCEQLLEALEEYESEQQENTSLVTTYPNNSESNEVNNIYDGMPSLPDLDFASMYLFDDGYQIAEFDYAPDGDTAIFALDNSSFKTRFLGVDTKEMSTDSGTPEPWAQQAKDFTNDILNNAHEIVLELDNNSDTFDNYDRLLAWIWVDGKLLNYMLAAKGFADVKYLYDDYKYNDDLLDAEYLAQNKSLGIWGDDEPYYNPSENIYTNNTSDIDYITISEARSLSIGTKVIISGIVTNKIGNNAFIQDSTGGIYIFTKNINYSALMVGNEVIIEGELSDYNGLLEIVNFDGSDIRIVSENNTVHPKNINLSSIFEGLESQYVKVENVEITFVECKEDEKGYSLFIYQNGSSSEIRIDKYLTDYPNPESLVVGSTINVVGNIAQHYDSYQIMISGNTSIIYP